MRPVNKYIVIKPIEEQVTTSSGLMLSAEDSSSMRYKTAQVIEVGDQVGVVSKGDKINYDKRQSFSMLINDESYTIISERDVVLVL